MRTSSLKVEAGKITYLIDDPKGGDGLKATVSAIKEPAADSGELTKILYRDRINLDRAKDRAQFAAQARIDPADLNEVRDRVLDFLTPASPVGNDNEAGEPDPAVQSAALDLLNAADLLDKLGKTLKALGYAGDLTQPLLIFLVFVSRLLRRPMNLVVGGPSAAGKSFVVSLVAQFFPPNATYALNGMSERLLAYTDADLSHRTLIIGEATALHHDGIGASLLRSLAWEGHIVYETVESTPEGLKPRRIEKEGPTGFVTTTTKSVEPELETRVLTINIADDKHATQEVIKVTAERANGRRPEDPDLRAWHEAQRILAEEGDHEVTIPFAEMLAAHYPADQVRARRDFTQLLALVQASAVLHQFQRERDEFGRIIANAADYAAVYRLAAPIFGAITAEGVTPAVRETVAKVEELTVNEAATVSVGQLAEALDRDKSAVSRTVKKALRGAFLVNEETGRGKPYKLRVGDPLPKECAALPSCETVFSPSTATPATLQHSSENPRNGAENGCCSAEEASMQQRNGSALGVAGVAQVLHSPMQQQNPRNGAENHPMNGECCSVALGEIGHATGNDAEVIETIAVPHNSRERPHWNQATRVVIG